MNFRYALALLLSAALCAVSAEEAEPENLLSNPSFEQAAEDETGKPTGWDWFSSGVYTMSCHEGDARTGEYCFRMAAQKKPDAYSGIFQRRPVHDSSTYHFSAYVRRDKNDTLGGSAGGQLVVEWMDAQNREISRIYSDSWSKNLSGLRWTHVALSDLNPPDGAEEAVFGIHFSDNKDGGRGAFLVDDVSVVAE